MTIFLSARPRARARRLSAGTAIRDAHRRRCCHRKRPQAADRWVQGFAPADSSGPSWTQPIGRLPPLEVATTKANSASLSCSVLGVTGPVDFGDPLELHPGVTLTELRGAGKLSGAAGSLDLHSRVDPGSGTAWLAWDPDSFGCPFRTASPVQGFFGVDAPLAPESAIAEGAHSWGPFRNFPRNPRRGQGAPKLLARLRKARPGASQAGLRGVWQSGRWADRGRASQLPTSRPNSHGLGQGSPRRPGILDRLD